MEALRWAEPYVYYPAFLFLAIAPQQLAAFPVKLAVRFCNWDIVDAGKPPHHQPILGKFPIFVATGTIPLARRIMPLILKSHRNPMLHKAPRFFF